MPSRTVVTIAMTDGAHAEDVARGAAERLGYRYVNDQVIDLAAEKAGVDAKTLAAAEHSEPLVARIMRGMASLSLDSGGFVSPQVVMDQTPAYRALIQDVVRAVAAEGMVVIGAHGASISLAGTPGLLRVFVTATPAARVSRVAAERRSTDAEARKEVDHTDRERKGYFERFFGIGAEQPTHYDLVINTETLSTEAAVAAIVGAAGQA